MFHQAQPYLSIAQFHTNHSKTSHIGQGVLTLDGGGGGVPTLDKGCLPWMGKGSYHGPRRGYLTWMGGAPTHGWYPQ